MLVLTRRMDESIVIGDDIRVTVVAIKGDHVRLGVEAPRATPIHREEVYEEIQQENRAAAAASPLDTDQLSAAGDLLDLHVALAPCVIGYAEIGRHLVPEGVDALGDHPYREWIAEYAGDAYQAVAAKARRHLDDLAARAMTERRFNELAALFGKASRLEADFWQMGFDGGR